MKFKSFINEESSVREKIIDFFNKHKGKIKDSEIHDFSDKIGMDTHKFEEEVYSLLYDLMKGKDNGVVGKHNNIPDEKFDEKELKMGIEVEYEHTDDRDIAEGIAKDHLSEFPDYYTRLKKMETEGFAHWKGKETSYYRDMEIVKKEENE